MVRHMELILRLSTLSQFQEKKTILYRVSGFTGHALESFVNLSFPS